MANYIGEIRYETDDESDACACVIAWLIRNGYMDTIPLAKYESTYMTTTGKELVKESIQEEVNESHQ